MYIAGLHPGAPKGNPEVSVGIVYSCSVGTPSCLTLGSHTEDTLSLSLELDGRLGFPIEWFWIGASVKPLAWCL